MFALTNPEFDAVQACPDFERVAALPRRDWVEKVRSEGLVDLFTEFFAREGSPRRLFEIQACALEEAVECGGLITAAAVGAGKMTLNLLLPVVLAASKPILLVPASIEEQTDKEIRDLLQFWKRGNAPLARIVTYQSLGVESGEYLLDGIKPDLIIADEVQFLRNVGASVTRRVGRYIAKNPSVKFCAHTGSLTRKSLHDFAHLLIWALRERAPVPMEGRTIENWARALDHECGAPLEPGALLDLPGDGSAKEKFQKRLRETPGVLITTEQSCDVPLTTRIQYAKEDTRIDDLFQMLDNREDDTFDVPDARQKALLKQTLGMGFRYRWRDPAPKAWIRARRNWYAFCRERIEASQDEDRPLDCERAVARAYKDLDVTKEWKEIRGTFEPVTIPVWHSYSVIEEIELWLQNNTPGLVFVNFTAIGKELAARTGLHYYGEKGQTEDGRKIALADPKKSAILSLPANRLGRNLQDWCRTLIVPPPTSSERLEQTIGRTHRNGQKQDEVFVTFLIGCSVHKEALNKAIAESEHVRDLQGHECKILLAPPPETELPKFSRRWA
jgi:hypothetical protein